MNKKIDVKKLTILSMFATFSIILSYVEVLIPFNIGVYGFKIGLANIATVVIIYLYGCKEAFAITFVRILIISMLFGTAFSFAFSLAGGVVSVAIMCLIKKYLKTHIIFTSAIGGITHNLAQILVASWIVSSKGILSLIPLLVILGLVTGIVVGIVGFIIYGRVKKYIRRLA